MAIKYRASWNTSENEALIQFDFVEDRGASGSAQVLMPRSVMTLPEEKQAEEAFRRFLEIHAGDFVTDERIKEQGEQAEVANGALLELSLMFFSLQQEIDGLKEQIENQPVEEETDAPDETTHED